MRDVRRLLPLLLGVVVLLVGFRIWVPEFLATKNMLDLAQQISVNAVIAYGMTLTILIGGIDLSVGALLALVGTVTVYTLSRCAPESQSVLALLLALSAGLGTAALFGAFNGVCAAKTPMPPFIITLATMLVARGAALRFNQGRPMHVPDEQSGFIAIGNGWLFETIPIPVLIMGTILIVMTVLLHRTLFGQHLFAIGGNREASRLSGIPLFRREVGVYVLCSLLTGVAGLIHASQLYSAEPGSGTGFELNAIAAVVVGGTSFTGGIGSMPGTFLGAVIIGILDKGLNQAGVHFSLQYMVKGAVILAAVYADVRRGK